MIKITEEIYHELEEDYSGICLKCKTVRYGDTEPDAREYPCASCNENKVYGISELLVMGLIELVDDSDININY